MTMGARSIVGDFVPLKKFSHDPFFTLFGSSAWMGGSLAASDDFFHAALFIYPQNRRAAWATSLAAFAGVVSRVSVAEG